MSYSLINGAAINGEEGGATIGIDLVVAGASTFLPALIVSGAQPLELGEPRAMVVIQPPGTDLVHPLSGGATAIYVQSLQPPGMDLVHADPGLMVSALLANGVQPLEPGAPRVRNGVDVALAIEGIDLVRSEFGVITLEQPGSGQALLSSGHRPLEFGAPRAVPGAITAQVGGVRPLELGGPTSVAAARDSGSRPMELGHPTANSGMRVLSVRPLEVGAPRVVTAFAMEGLDLCRVGSHRMGLGTNALLDAGGFALEMGMPGTPSSAVMARQNFTLALGQPAVQRGTAC